MQKAWDSANARAKVFYMNQRLTFISKKRQASVPVSITTGCTAAGLTRCRLRTFVMWFFFSTQILFRHPSNLWFVLDRFLDYRNFYTWIDSYQRLIESIDTRQIFDCVRKQFRFFVAGMQKTPYLCIMKKSENRLHLSNSSELNCIRFALSLHRQ